MDWSKILSQVSAIVTAAEPIVNAGVAAFAPEASAGLSIAEKLLQGVAAGAPTAVALVSQITSGTPLTQAQVQAFEAEYATDYAQTKADITAALAALPA